MNIALILPFLLFLLSIVINLLIINSKLNSNKKINNVQKDILNRLYSTEKSIKEALISYEEKFSEQKNSISTLAFEVDRKLKQLQSHGQELAKLANTLNEYRSMLASLEVATNKTHEWVVNVRSDCENLEKLKELIKEHQSETYKIIDSYESAIDKQNSFYGDYESKLEDLRNSYIFEIDNYIKNFEEKINSKVISLNQASKILDTKINESTTLSTNIEEKSVKINEDFEKSINSIKNVNTNLIKEFDEKIKNVSKLKFEDYKKDINLLNNEEKEKYIDNIKTISFSKIEEIEKSIDIVVDSINYCNHKKDYESNFEEDKTTNDNLEDNKNS